MKTIVPILCLCAAVLMAQDQLADPFGSPPNKLKRAVELEKCVNGHKTLKDVQIAYGRGAGNDRRDSGRNLGLCSGMIFEVVSADAN